MCCVMMSSVGIMTETGTFPSKTFAEGRKRGVFDDNNAVNDQKPRGKRTLKMKSSAAVAAVLRLLSVIT